MKARLIHSVVHAVQLSAAITGLLLLVAVPLRAQTGYPPGPGTTAPAAVNGGQDVGNVTLGETVTRELCGYAPNSTVRISVNGSSVTTMTADGNGCVTVHLKVTSTSAVEVEGLTAVARCGGNTLLATGSQADGAAVNETITFDVACGSADHTAFTGANIARGTITGAALLGVGALTVLGGRRRRVSEV
jgi:hypothetical protein